MEQSVRIFMSKNPFTSGSMYPLVPIILILSYNSIFTHIWNFFCICMTSLSNINFTLYAQWIQPLCGPFFFRDRGLCSTRNSKIDLNHFYKFYFECKTILLTGFKRDTHKIKFVMEYEWLKWSHSNSMKLNLIKTDKFQQMFQSVIE